MTNNGRKHGFSMLWREHRVQFLLILLLIGGILGEVVKDLSQTYRQNQRYENIEKLRSKSDYHDRILRTYLACVRDDGEPESVCMSSTLQLADLNGYRDKVKEVFADAHIPSR